MATKEKEPKLTASEKRAHKRRETAAKMEQVFGTGKGSAEPTINPLDYTISLMRAMNYYNSAVDNKTKRKWFMAHVGKNSTAFDQLSDYHFRSVGTIIRLKQREQPLQERELNFIANEIVRLHEMAKSAKTVSRFEKQVVENLEEKPKVSVQDRMILSAAEHAGEINGLIDDFVKLGTDFDVASYLKANEVSAQVAKHIPQHFGKTIAELQEYLEGQDKQLIEGYSNLGKVKARKLVKTLEAIEDACKQQAVTAKATRKPRAKKEKPPAVVAKSVKYMKESSELGIKSVIPEKIIGSSEVWVFNTKYKKLQVYRSVGALGIKGTSILNYDVATSGSKTLRKPELVKGYADMTKRNLAQEFKNLKTKEAAVNGRINEDCVILRVFS
jgi:hypothetical protein